ncbi:Cd(II)/Pb(II)-responsive transcriptional regulator [Yanghanlia caeni]|uniref:Cd(II)/Pb(II)-responsive transcriptional regulator n=1 Tax=Yanghanlia caeni TaxID=3064283 RepID=A0ABU1D9X7_9BURK|nr:Cd(II)/Pb(II)-responsive transcriptional regulator [Alcaligenaceae bacterium LG-2]NGR09709.1 Cd(II)/Pb(II)-responsive transcriptional regulator [bacterium SGD-2]HZH56548.1 Cd(II)/Pb(II)-responsive transcriptional regulator [Burkholderiaceae bacterium]
MALRIGELAQRTQTTVETIRYYERERLLPAPARSAGNYRIYGDEHVERLRFIRHCRSLDMALDEIRSLLQHRDAPADDCTDVNNLLDQHIVAVEERMKELRQLKRHLVTLRRKCNQPAATANCGILRALADNSCHEHMENESVAANTPFHPR